MTSALEIHLYSLLLMIGGGVAISMLYDLARTLRRRCRKDSWAADLMDVAFWCLTIPILVILFLMASWGQLRLFLFLGLVFGATLYFWLASPYLLWFFDRCLAVFARLVRLAVLPLLFLMRLVRRTAILFWKPIRWLLLFIYRHLPVRLRQRIRTVYRHGHIWWRRVKRV